MKIFIYRIIIFFSLSIYSANLYSGFDWYWISEDCGPVSTYCCCENGSMICYLPGYFYYCSFGGFLNCTSDLSWCEGNVSMCFMCCPPCDGSGGSEPECDGCPVPFRA